MTDVDHTLPPGELRDTAGTAHRVDSHIFISGYLIASDPDFVCRNGITRIVKMFADDGSYQGGVHRHDGVKYLVVPADDTPSYDIRGGAEAAIRFIQEGIRRDEKILVHCHAGISRSSTVVLLHLMINQGMPLDAALSHLRRIRPIVNPNSGFMRHLRATDARIRGLKKGRAPRRAPLASQSVAANDLSLMLRISRGEMGHAGGKNAGTPVAQPPPAPPAPPRRPLARSAPAAWSFEDRADDSTAI